MSDAVLTDSSRKEALSCVYACAIAARAGYMTTTLLPDLDGVDLQIRAGGAMRPALDLQLKATVNLKRRSDGHLVFPLKRRNYDLLRIGTQTPRLLMVLDLPRDKGRWMSVTKNKLILRRRAYWLNLHGCKEVKNKTSVTVAIPKENLFDVKNLRSLMKRSRGGTIR